MQSDSSTLSNSHLVRHDTDSSCQRLCVEVIELRSGFRKLSHAKDNNFKYSQHPINPHNQVDNLNETVYLYFRFNHINMRLSTLENKPQLCGCIVNSLHRQEEALLKFSDNSPLIPQLALRLSNRPEDQILRERSSTMPRDFRMQVILGG